MGRYYSTETGREGKFMFGVQSSGDPQYMGMQEQEPTSVDYYADEEDVPRIKEMMDKQYDLLGVPKEARIYYTDKDWKKYNEFEKQFLWPQVFVSVREDDTEELEKYKDKVRWADDRPGYVCFEKGEERKNTLALARIRLGMTILSDIKDTGECWLNAEL